MSTVKFRVVMLDRVPNSPNNFEGSYDDLQTARNERDARISRYNDGSTFRILRVTEQLLEESKLEVKKAFKLKKVSAAGSKPKAEKPKTDKKPATGAVAAIIAMFPKKGSMVTRAEIDKVLRSNGIEGRYIGNVLAQLARSGNVQKVSDTLYKRT